MDRAVIFMNEEVDSCWEDGWWVLDRDWRGETEFGEKGVKGLWPWRPQHRVEGCLKITISFSRKC